MLKLLLQHSHFAGMSFQVACVFVKEHCRRLCFFFCFSSSALAEIDCSQGEHGQTLVLCAILAQAR